MDGPQATHPAADLRAELALPADGQQHIIAVSPADPASCPAGERPWLEALDAVAYDP